MALVRMRWRPSRAESRWFGVTLLLLAALVGGVFAWRGVGRTTPRVVWSVGALACVAYYAARPLRRPLYVCTTALLFPIRWTLAHAVMAVVYYLVLTPTALVLRLGGRDALRRRPDPDAATYWIERRPDEDPSRYFRQS